MGRYADQIEKRPEGFIAVVRDEKTIAHLRAYTAYKLGRNGPLDERVRETIDYAAKAFKGSESEDLMKNAQESFEKRMKEKPTEAR